MTSLPKIILFFFSLVALSLSTLTSAKSINHTAYTDVGHGQPLVLLHAWPADQRLWKPQQDGLSPHFRVISVDSWGFGGSSPWGKKSVSMEDYADQVKALLDRLHIKKAIIGGESMGGYVALAFLKKYPDNVQGLILSDTQSIADSPDMLPKREKQAASILADGTAPQIKQFMPLALSPHADEKTRAYLQHIFEDQSAEAMSASLLGIAYRTDTSQVLSKTELPVLVITGELDTLISPQQSKAMHALAKNSRLVVIKEAGHLSNLEKPSDWNQAVIDFFTAGKQ